MCVKLNTISGIISACKPILVICWWSVVILRLSKVVKPFDISLYCGIREGQCKWSERKIGERDKAQNMPSPNKEVSPHWQISLYNIIVCAHFRFSSPGLRNCYWFSGPHTTQFEKEILSLLNNAKDKILRNLRQKYPFTPDRTESKTKYVWDLFIYCNIGQQMTNLAIHIYGRG